MTHEQQAIDAWFNSSEGQTCLSLAILGSTTNKEACLRNCLQVAFKAGMKASLPIFLDRLNKQLESEDIVE